VSTSGWNFMPSMVTVCVFGFDGSPAVRLAPHAIRARAATNMTIRMISFQCPQPLQAQRSTCENMARSRNTSLMSGIEGLALLNDYRDTGNRRANAQSGVER
jgi:hypothetical protein